MFKKLIIILTSLLICFTGCATNPISGQEQFMLVSPDDEIEIGHSYAPEIEKQLGGRIENESLQNYIDSVGQRITRISHRPDLEYYFTALEDKSFNALALPGGYVFITKGMLKELKSEAQLAAILAHEISHVVARHASAAMSRQIGIGLLLSVAAAEASSQGAIAAADVAQKIISIQYTRADEQQADLAGLDYMVLAGYNPYAMVETMQMLESKREVATPTDFFSTHPAPYNRMTYLKQRIQTKYYNLGDMKVAEQDYQKFVLENLED